MDYPKSFSEIQKKSYPNLNPLFLDLSMSAAFERVRQALHETDWEIVSEDRRTGVLEAMAQTFLFRFRDDVVIEVRPEINGSSIHVRSKSRDGRGDAGANAQRIRTFLDKLVKQ